MEFNSLYHCLEDFITCTAEFFICGIDLAFGNYVNFKVFLLQSRIRLGIKASNLHSLRKVGLRKLLI